MYNCINFKYYNIAVVDVRKIRNCFPLIVGRVTFLDALKQ